jgi:catechol 2,3-dioxygenase-like lactoylglutathione lyase family enzyme
MLKAIDHVQLAMPRDGEDRARQFYDARLGLVEEPKPPVLAARGGCWFGEGSVRVHPGVDADFRAARKAHPAFRVAELAAFVVERGLDVQWDDDVAGVVRCYVDDPFGNRIELIEDDST